MEFSSSFFHLLFFSQILQLSNTIVSSTEVQIPASNVPTNKLDSLTEQIPSFDSFTRTFNKSYPTDVKPAAIEVADIDDDEVDDEEDEKDADIGKRLVRQRIKRYSFDGVFVDHRESGCLAEEPRSQGICLASFAFATIAFYEWVYCMRTGGFKAFSEQYIIDCGHRYGSSGCSGSGKPITAVQFVYNCGLTERQQYPFIGRRGICPYDDSVPPEDMGSVHINGLRLKAIPLDQQSLEDNIEYGPIIVTIKIGGGFLSYAGEVDDNEGYDPELLHTMLLIGHGRENGQDYWLFRNSYSFDFGADEFGHYKLKKNVDCFEGEFGFGLDRPLFE